jgi:hypothetical protein
MVSPVLDPLLTLSEVDTVSDTFEPTLCPREVPMDSVTECEIESPKPVERLSPEE